MKKIKVRITFTEAVLGTWPSNQNIAREFIASKSPDASTIEDEVAALGADAVADKGMTVFLATRTASPSCMTTRSKACLRMLAVCWVVSAARPKPEKESRQRIRQADSLQEGH